MIQDETVTQNDTSKSADIDAEAAAELEGVPDSLKEQGDGQAALEERIATLEAQLADIERQRLVIVADQQADGAEAAHGIRAAP